MSIDFRGLHLQFPNVVLILIFSAHCFVYQIFLLLGDIAAAKRTLKKAYKMHLGVNDADQSRLADLLKSGLFLHFVQISFFSVTLASLELLE